MMIIGTLLLILIKLIVGLTALSVLLSYTVAWYERANTRPDLIDRRFTARGLFIAIWLLLLETGCLLLTIALRPLGWLPERLPDAGQENQTPIILLHGLFQNRSCMYWLQYQLRATGYTRVISISTPPWRDLETLTEKLAKKVDELNIKWNAEKVILIGHSMGGIIARNYIQNRGGNKHTLAMITIGSPHHGSKLAPFAVSSMGKLLLPGSEFLRQFNQVNWPQEVKAFSLFTRYDNIVLPAETAKMDGAQNIELDGMGHTSLLFHPKSIQSVTRTLSEILNENTDNQEQPTG